MPGKPTPIPLRATYDQDVDALTIDFVPAGRTARTIEVRPGLYIDVDRSGAILAVEVLEASKKYGVEALRNLPAPGPHLKSRARQGRRRSRGTT
ncbi:MAG TPA: DUF2283 domain-containing protein [Vicinamibacterales bacterium]|nr:DUF2283 domain-containing protein [Vicinamibacterales bacterium]